MAYTSSETERGGKMMSASELKGKSVLNIQEEKLGTLEDLMIDCETGQLSFAVMAGEGNRIYTLPWNAVAVDPVKKCLVIDLQRQALESMQGISRDQWSGTIPAEWKGHGHFGKRPFWELTKNKWISGP